MMSLAFSLTTVLLLIMLLVSCHHQSTSALVNNNNNSIKQIWQFNNSELSGPNISYGDPHRWVDENDQWRISQVFSNNSGTYILTFLNPTTSTTSSSSSTSLHHQNPPVFISKLTNSIFPTLSGWISSSEPNSQDSSVCPEPVCFYIGTMKGVAAVGARSGKILWNTNLFSTEQQVPGHVTFTSWTKFQGVVWVTFESGVSSSNVFVLAPLDGSFYPVVPRSDGVNEVAYTLLWPIEWSASDLNPVFSSAVVYGAYHTGTKKVGVVCRAVVASSSSSSSSSSAFPPRIVELWSNWSFSYRPPGLWDNPNFDVDLVSDAKLYNFKQHIFAYLEPSTTHRIVNRLRTMTGDFEWNVNTFADVPDYDTYAYRGNFFRLMVRKNNTLQLEKMNGETGAKMWEYQQSSFSDSGAILLVGSGIVTSFGLSTGVIVVLNEQQNGQLIGTIDMSGKTDGGLSTGVTIPIVNRNSTVLIFGDTNGNVYGFDIEL